MIYKHPPIFKYIFLLLCIFMFITHFNIIQNHENLFISITITIMVIMFDYILIENHPELLNNDIENFVSSSVTDIVSDKDIEDIIQSYSETQDFKENIDDLNNDQAELSYPRTKAFLQLPTDYSQPSYDLNVDCYRRGDGRGGNINVQRYYEHEIL